MKKLFVLMSVAVVLALAIPAGATPPEDSKNEVSDWCNGSDGIKYEPVATPFIVPAPPAGTVWTKIVVKAGSGAGQNETWDYPDVGGWYSHSEHDNSHVILCYEELTVTTTVPTTIPDTTTTIPDTTTTTDPETTTTTGPETTTTTDPETTTTTDPGTTTTTDPVTTTTAQETTTIPEVSTDIPELPVTGIDSGWFVLAGLLLLATGLGGLAIARRT